MQGDNPDAETAQTVLAGWLTRDELARELGLSVLTLQKWATMGVGPVHIRIGTRAHYRRETVQAWLVEQEQRKRPK